MQCTSGVCVSEFVFQNYKVKDDICVIITHIKLLIFCNGLRLQKWKITMYLSSKSICR